MPKLVATQDLRYAAVNLTAGDEFDAPDTDARILKAIGKAKDAPSPTTQMKALTPEKAAPPAASETLFKQESQTAEKPGRRTYRRRDMVAED